MKETYDYLRKAGVFYLATIEENKPKVRPFEIVEIYDDKLYVLTGKKKQVSKQIQNNPNVEICTVINETWIRVETKLIRDDGIETKKNILEKNPQLKSMYSAEDDNTEVLYFKDAKSIIYSFTEEPKIYRF